MVVVGGGGARDGGTAKREGEGTAAGGRQPRGKGKERAVTPAAWPPGGLGEGEGLRINDLPDVSRPFHFWLPRVDGATFVRGCMWVF